MFEDLFLLENVKNAFLKIIRQQLIQYLLTLFPIPGSKIEHGRYLAHIVLAKLPNTLQKINKYLWLWCVSHVDWDRMRKLPEIFCLLSNFIMQKQVTTAYEKADEVHVWLVNKIFMSVKLGQQ